MTKFRRNLHIYFNLICRVFRKLCCVVSGKKSTFSQTGEFWTPGSDTTYQRPNIYKKTNLICEITPHIFIWRSRIKCYPFSTSDITCWRRIELSTPCSKIVKNSQCCTASECIGQWTRWIIALAKSCKSGINSWRWLNNNPTGNSLCIDCHNMLTAT